jgi:hypothetical protein
MPDRCRKLLYGFCAVSLLNRNNTLQVFQAPIRWIAAFRFLNKRASYTEVLFLNLLLNGKDRLVIRARIRLCATTLHQKEKDNCA